MSRIATKDHDCLKLLSMTYNPAAKRASPTHTNPETHARVTAWHYLSTSPIPIWVARNFHDIGNGKRTHRSGYAVPEGDWIIDLGGSAIVLTDAEFQKCFEPVKP
jgi:hypothetical protein